MRNICHFGILCGFNKYHFPFSEIAVNATCHTQNQHQCKDVNAECKSSNGNKCLCKDAYYLKGNTCTSRMSFCRTIQLYSVTALTRDSTVISTIIRARVIMFNATFSNISVIS